MTKVNFLKHMEMDDLLSMLFVEALSYKFSTEELAEFLNSIGWGEDGHDGTLDIKLVIEGEEFDAVPVIEEWQSAVDDMIESEARQLLKDKVFDLSRKLDDIETSIDAIILDVQNL